MRFDVIVIGGGIAGMGVAAELARDCSVLLVEREATTAYHATGRSAAVFGASYGNSVIRALTHQSEAFFHHPPADFSEVRLFVPRPWAIVARNDQQSALKRWAATNPALLRCDADQIRLAAPLLASGFAAGGLIDTACGDLDVDALVQGYSRQFRRRDGLLLTDAWIERLDYSSGKWAITVKGTEYSAPVIVNAAGAWADAVATSAGLTPIGLRPLRRTAILVDAPANTDITDHPVVLDAEEQFYFKPEAGKVLISPADESETEPGDAAAEEYEVALAVDHYQRATGAEIHRVAHRWAGLRTFAADRSPVVGFDPSRKGFFWLAGQGGYGVQTAPALSSFAAALVLGKPVEHELMAAMTPQRFR
jgi:D-arginine dehydrogenase